MTCNCGKNRVPRERWVPRSRRADPTPPADAPAPGPSHRIVTGSEQAREVALGRPPRAKQPTG